MAPAIIFGLTLVGAGILGMAVSRVLTDIAANSHAYLRPQLDKAAFKRRNVRIVRYMAGAWIALGLGLTVFGLVTGP
jgi:hypothetical protein